MWSNKLSLKRTGPDGFTPADIDAASGGALQYELVDGMIVVTPPQGSAHHAAVVACLRLLMRSCPVQLWVFAGPVDYRPTEVRSLRVDVLVCRREDLSEKAVQRPPLLAVEIMTSTTRLFDQTLKRGLYEQAGVAAYWMFEPEGEVLTVLELVEGRYVERAVVTGDDVFEVELPFPVRIVPTEFSR